MNLSRCENGHFYDKEKYASCPHCAQGGGDNEGLTTVYSEQMDSNVGVTEPLDMPTGAMDGDFAPTPIFGGAPSPSGAIPPRSGAVPSQAPASIPGATPIPGAMPVPGTAQSGGMFEDATERLGSAGGPMVGNPVAQDDDDDHTVAFYDDIFATESPAQLNPTPAATPAPAMSAAVPPAAPAVMQPARTAPARVNTPCVGWLIALNNAHVGQDFRLKTGKNFIGRDAKMDVVLDGDKSVSRNKHAILVYEPKQHLYMIQPGESSELVYLNDEVVLSPMKLSAYDVVMLGEVRLLFIPLCGEKFNWTEELQKNKR